MHRTIINQRIVRRVVAAVLVLIVLASGIASSTSTRHVASDDFINGRARLALPAIASDDFINSRARLLQNRF